jgi:hypothetical protein
MTPIVMILIVVFVVAPLAAAAAHRIESGPDRRVAPPAIDDPERIERIEGQIDALVDQMRELAEHQEFLTRLLEERTESGRPALMEDGDR